jgi:uncharacterized membrane protein
MLRATVLLRERRWEARARRLARALSPVAVSPAAPRETVAALDDDQRGRLRAVVVSHDNDPIAVFGPDLLVQRPAWLADGQRGRGVPEQMRWLPLGTFLQTEHPHTAPPAPADRERGDH